MEKTRDEITDRPASPEESRGDEPVRGSGSYAPTPQRVVPAGTGPAPPVDDPRGFNWRTFDPEMLRGKVDTLVTELVTYRDRLDEILVHEGEYVLIKGDRIVGYFPSQGEALAVAVETFGREPCLIKRVVEFQRPIWVGNVL